MNERASLLPLVRRSRLNRAEQQFAGACRELRRVEAIREEVEITLHLIASHPHGGLLSDIASEKLKRLGGNHDR
jgi:hypothetical protein